MRKKTFSFKKHEKKSYSSSVTIINGLQQYEHVHIQVPVISASAKEVKKWTVSERIYSDGYGKVL